MKEIILMFGSSFVVTVFILSIAFLPFLRRCLEAITLRLRTTYVSDRHCLCVCFYDDDADCY